MAPALRATALSIMVAMLGACGSGGGGGGTTLAPAGGTPPAPSGGNPPPAAGNPPPAAGNPPSQTAPRVDVPFTQFSMVLPNTNVNMAGTGTSVSGTHKSNGPVTSIDLEVISGPANLALGFDGQRTLSALTLNSPETGNVLFDRAAGHSISCPLNAFCTASNHATASAVVADAFANGWNYQTFGAWATATGPTSLVLSAMSAGNITPGSAVPTTGVVTFGGVAAGYFIDPAGTQFSTQARLSAQVDFQNRAIGFRTTDTEMAKANTNRFSENATLNLSGTLSWAPGQAAFGGPVKSANPNLSGSAAGSFYGPKAEEMGGTYSLTGGGVSRMVGGFGGKQQ